MKIDKDFMKKFINKKVIIGVAAAVVVIPAAIFGAIHIANMPVSGTVDEKNAAAKELVEDGRLTKAENTYKSVLEEDAANTEAAVGLSDVYVKEGKYEEAAQAIKNSIAAAPDNTALYNELIGVYRASGDTQSALSYIESIDDATLRREYLDAAYDRNSENSLVVGNTMGNLSSGGVVAFKDDMIFYCDVAGGNMLYRLKDGEKTLICDGNISSLNVVGEYLYFVDKARDYSIYKIKTDGTEHSRVSETMATNLIVIGNKMYFINWMDECRVYSMNLDGTESTKLTDKSTEMLYAYGTSLYINDRNDDVNFYRLALDGSSETYIANESVYFVTGYDNNIYFRGDNDGVLNIYRMTTDGTVYEPINSSRSGYINADKGYVFFVDFANEGSIVRMKEDGSEQTILCSDGATNLSVDGDYLYYFSDYNDKKLYRIRKDGTGRECLN